MGTKWRGNERTYVRPKHDRMWLVAGIVLAVVASVVHFVVFPLDAGATTRTTSTTYTSDAEQTITRIRVRGDGCLQAEDSTRLRLVEYAPSRHVVVYRCVTP